MWVTRSRPDRLLGEMDPVDLDERIRAQEAALKRAEAQLSEAQARQSYAQTQARRYEQLLTARSTSEEIVATKKHELTVRRGRSEAWQVRNSPASMPIVRH